MTYDYDAIMEAIRESDFEAMNELAGCWDKSPSGKDDFLGRHWITNATEAIEFLQALEEEQ